MTATFHQRVDPRLLAKVHDARRVYNAQTDALPLPVNVKPIRFKWMRPPSEEHPVFHHPCGHREVVCGPWGKTHPANCSHCARMRNGEKM